MNSSMNSNFDNIQGIPPQVPNAKGVSSDDELSKLRTLAIKTSDITTAIEADVIPIRKQSLDKRLEKIEQASIIEKTLSSNEHKVSDESETMDVDELENVLMNLDLDVLQSLLSSIEDNPPASLTPSISSYEKDMQIIQDWIKSSQGKSCLNGKDLVSGDFVKFSRRNITDLSHSYMVTLEGSLKQQLHKTTGLGLLHHVKDTNAFIGKGGMKTAMGMADENGSVSDVRAVIHNKDVTDLKNAIEATKNPKFKDFKHLLVGHYVTYKSEKSGKINEAFLSPYMSGGDLENKTLSYKKAINFSLQIAAGLNVVHQEEWAHLDIKPANFFYAEDGKGGHIVKLADFDFAKNLKNADINLKIDSGTPGYLSPELTRGECFGLTGAQENDIFALGVSMLELVGFSIWNNFMDAPKNVAGKTDEQILKDFHVSIGNLKPGSTEHIKMEKQFKDFKKQQSPLKEHQENYLNLAWRMINPEAYKRPKIIDVALELLMQDLVM